MVLQYGLMYKTHQSTKMHLNFYLDFLVWDHTEIIVVSYPCKDAPLVLVLNFTTKRRVLYTGGHNRDT